jgi:hypothetical protein
MHRRTWAGLSVCFLTGFGVLVACSSSSTDTPVDEDAGDGLSDTGTTTPDAGRDAGSAKENIDCAWIQSEKDCWGAALKEAAACAPSKGAYGVFANDLKSCTYATGEKITFATPFAATGRVEFSSTDRSGAPCATVLQPRTPEGDFYLTTKSGKVKVVMGSNFELTITCPDGRVAYTPNWQGKDFGACGFPATGQALSSDMRDDAAVGGQSGRFGYGETKTNGVDFFLCATQ